MYVVIAHGAGIAYPVGVYESRSAAIEAAEECYCFRAKKYIVSAWKMGGDEPDLIFRVG